MGQDRIPFQILFKIVHNNNIYLLQLGCHPVAVVILRVYKTLTLIVLMWRIG